MSGSQSVNQILSNTQLEMFVSRPTHDSQATHMQGIPQCRTNRLLKDCISIPATENIVSDAFMFNISEFQIEVGLSTAAG